MTSTAVESGTTECMINLTHRYSHLGMNPTCDGANVPKGDWEGNVEGGKVKVTTSWCTREESHPVFPVNGRKLLHPGGFLVNNGKELCFLVTLLTALLMLFSVKFSHLHGTLSLLCPHCVEVMRSRDIAADEVRSSPYHGTSNEEVAE